MSALPIPIGWFVVAWSDELGPNEVRPVRAFGEELVLWRTADGRPVLQAAFCPHLGAHLGHGGAVDGATLRCPFHGWSFAADGRCAGIPYAERVPPGAKLRTWPVREHDGVIDAWHHPDGAPPGWEPPDLHQEGLTEPRRVTWTIRSHPQEIAENTVDTAHLGPVHDARRARVIEGPAFDGPRLDIRLGFDAPGDIVGMPGTINDVELRVRAAGLGTLWVETTVHNVGVRARQRLHVTPIDADRVCIRGVVQVERTPDEAFTATVAEEFYSAFCSDFAKDFPIWENKRYVQPPLLVREDGPIGRYRSWARQFHPGRTGAVEAAPEPLAAPGLWERLRGWWRPTRPIPPDARPPETAPPPARRPIRSAAEYFDTLAERFVPTEATGLSAVVAWKLTGDEPIDAHVRIEDGALTVVRGPHPAPDLLLTLAADDQVKLINGELDGARLFVTGRARLSGDLKLAMRMERLFPR